MYTQNNNNNITPLSGITSSSFNQLDKYYYDSQLNQKRLFYTELADLLNFTEKEKTSIAKMISSIDQETLGLLKILFKSKMEEYIKK